MNPTAGLSNPKIVPLTLIPTADATVFLVGLTDTSTIPTPSWERI